MTTSTADVNELRRRLYQCTELRAEAISDEQRLSWCVDVFGDGQDPVLEMIEAIAWSQADHVALGLAGGSGVGKTTQLFRMIQELWDRERLLGIRINYEDYSSLSSPPDITDFLLSISAGFADAAVTLGYVDSGWDDSDVNDRLVGLLRRLRFEPEVSAGPLKVKASLREDETFRRQLRNHLAGQVAPLVREVREFVGSLVDEICINIGECQGVVLLVDSTERLSAPASADAEMQAAIRNLFIQNGENLRFDSAHVVYLLPPWLPITDGGGLRLETVMFPSLRVERRDGSDDEHGLDLLDQIVKRRMPDINRLLSQQTLTELYRSCGGVQRVLFLLLKEVAGRARSAQVLPLEEPLVATAIDSVRQDYLAISSEAVPSLRHIDSSKSVDGLREIELSQLGRYFQALVVLQVANGEKWFTIHPLMRHRLHLVNRIAL